jgi:hypothetical protein
MTMGMQQPPIKSASVHKGCQHVLGSSALDDYLDLLADYNHEYDFTAAMETTKRLFSSNMDVACGKDPYMKEALDSVLDKHRKLHECSIKSSSHLALEPNGNTSTVQSALLSPSLEQLQRSVMLDHSYCRPSTPPIKKCPSSPLAEDCSSVQTEEKQSNVKVPESKPTLKEVNGNIDLKRQALLARKTVPRRYLVY